MTGTRKSVLFYDSTAPRPYSHVDFARVETGLGGAEMTVARVAERLGQEYEVYVAQVRRTTPVASNHVQYVGADTLEHLTPHAVVSVRNPVCLPTLRQRFPDASLYLWVHDWPMPFRGFIPRIVRWYVQFRVLQLIARTNTTVIALSRAHHEHLRQLIQQHIPGRFYKRRIRSLYIYNPVCVEYPVNDYGGNGHAVDINKLIYFSSPVRGLHIILKAFQFVRQRLPDLKLYVAIPPYSSLNSEMEQAVRDPSIVNLGRLNHDAVIAHVRTALCCFYPADVQPESFGLVFAESNAVGTPVLAHPFGAAPEVLTADQLCDARDLEGIVKRLELWRQPGQRPQLPPRPEFTLDQVARHWQQVLFQSNSH